MRTPKILLRVLQIICRVLQIQIFSDNFSSGGKVNTFILQAIWKFENFDVRVKTSENFKWCNIMKSESTIVSSKMCLKTFSNLLSWLTYN